MVWQNGKILTHFRARVRGGLYRRLQPVAARYWKNLCPPISVTHKLTLKCNARCVHCDIWMKRFENEELSTSEVKSLYSQLRQWFGPFPFVMTGGEALLRPDAVELAIHAARLGLLVEFLTNGYLLEEAAEGLARSGVERVTISCDGVNPETLNAVRGKSDFFERIAAGVKRLAAYRAESGNHFNIWLKTVVMQNNLAELADIAKMAREWGADVFYQPIEQNYAQKYNSSWYKESDLWIRNTDHVVRVIDELILMKQKGLPIANSEANLKVMSDYFRNPEPMMRSVREHVAEGSSAMCLSGVNYFEILPWGGVKVCGEGEEIGSIRKMSPREIWRNRPVCWRGNCTVA